MEKIISLLFGILFSLTSYYPAPVVQSASSVADPSPEIEIAMGPFVEEVEPTLTPTPTETPALLPTLSPTPSPTNTIISTRTPTATATIRPSKTPTKIPTMTSTPKPFDSSQGKPFPTIATYSSTNTATASAKISLNAETIFQRISEYRKTLNLPAFEKHEYLCKLAEDRGPELYNEIFGKAYVHEGFYARNLPYWITENMAHYDTEEKILNWWLNSTVHRRAIQGNYKYSCGACVGNSCVQLFTNFVKR